MKDKLAEIKSYLTGSKVKYTILYVLSAIFIGLNCYLVYREIYWLLLLPLLMVVLYLYFYSLDKILLLITLLTPVAVNITQFEFGVGVSLPTEPLMFGVLIMFVLKLIFDNTYDKKIWKHPLTIIIIIQLVWIFITSLTSQIPLVSFKFLLARLWFVIPFFIFGIHLFRKVENIRVFIWLYAIPLAGVIFYTTYQHSLWAFEEKAGHWVMEPFYNDHTAYGAILALYIPFFISFGFSSLYSRLTRFFAFIMLGILFMALYLSFCRAAWISLAMALGVFLVVIFRIRFKWIAVGSVILGALFFLFQYQILDRLEKNKQGTSANFVEHIRSISNISTDNSNLERINRWQSALRMFEEHPVFGFGPGTYQFEYAPFQRSEERTLISTNAGDKGNAHSEYIGPLAEQGLPAMLIVITIVVIMIMTAMKVYRQAEAKEVRVLALTSMLALITYFIHGLMNNFLDTDKASVPVWGFMAIIVALDLYSKKKPALNKEE
jgi:putative inorganic carbon (HCO3(-)) transporter